MNKLSESFNSFCNQSINEEYIELMNSWMKLVVSGTDIKTSHSLHQVILN